MYMYMYIPGHVLEYEERERFKLKLSRAQCRDLIETLCRHDAKVCARRICDQFAPAA